MYRLILILIAIVLFISCNPKLSNGLRVNDLKKDVEMITEKGTIIIRLSDSTPLHRDNFLRLIKQGYFDSVLFHRVIKNFMIQGGDPNSKHAKADSVLGDGGPSYTIPAEFRSSLFHRKGVIAAAREGDDSNPAKASSGSQFYIVQGKTFTDAGLDSVETNRMKGRKIPEAYRQVYKTIGGTPHLDQNYTIFGEVISGLSVVDSIAAVQTSGKPYDRPLNDVRILKMKLINRSK
ncbi:MAG: peptidylprolyl isomerase [Bacteroidetes bacterium]|nr:peptidylprolyl isomerase [Bacteroidota bacterium]